MLEGGCIDEAIEGLCQRAGDFGRATGAWALHETLRARVGKAVDPLAQRSIGTVQRVGDRLEALAFDNIAHRLGTAEDPCLFRLFQEDI